ncbi:serine-type D-Ala-D-Ala endopeptidase (penicillin-binding protein 7) [Gallionellaceae bacterium]|nr:serine-type D-Ala-D-Ala endopeptidase (penicillin-binding protein 7) [Gallionellaceae bacterium]
MRKILLMFLLLGHVLSAQAAENEAIRLIQDDELTSTVLKRTASPKLRSAIALIYDEQGSRVLYAKNADTIAPIASITKLMTAMIVLDAQLPLDEEISISVQDMDMLKGTHSRMSPGMALSRGELLKLALMSSENRAAAALARTYPGGTVAAVAKMNAKARELGMKNTRFLDPSGLNSGNVSTAQDLVKMVQAAQSYDLIQKFTTASSHIVDVSGHRPMRFNNTNPLVKSASWNIGVSKTGFINEAGRCLVMQANIRQRPVVIVLLDSAGKQTRVGDANRIKKWMESAYTRVRSSRKG